MTTVTQLLKDSTPDVRALALAARETVRKAVPRATEKVHPGWHIIAFHVGKRGQFCAVSPLKDRVNLYFMHGVGLPDPRGLLAGTGKGMRHIRITSLIQLRSAGVKALIKSAAARSEMDRAVRKR